MIAAFVVAFAAPAFAKTETVKGRIVDVSCYMKDKANNAGNDHKMPADTKECAAACARKGAPMALLTDDGKVYQLTGGLAADKNAKIIQHVAHIVEVTGDVTEKDGKMMLEADSLKMISK
jgi:predicted metal-binding protein